MLSSDTNLEQDYIREKSFQRIFPDDDVWEWIQDDLDIQDTWNRVQLALERRDYIQGIVKTAMNSILVIALVAVAGILTFYAMRSQPGEPTISSAFSGGTRHESIAPLSDKTASMRESNAGLRETSRWFEEKPKVLGPVLATDKIYPVFSVFHLEKVEPGQLARVQIPTRNCVKTDRSSSEPEWWAFADTRKEKKSGKYYVGGIGGVKNQWMLSQSSINSFKQATPAYPVAVFSQNYGLSAGTVISKNLNIQSDLFFVTKNGLKQVDYESGQSVSRELQFGYYKLGLAAVIKKKMFRWRSFPVSNHFLLGAYGAWLRSGQMIVDQELITDISNDYRKSDLGLVAGYEIGFPAGKHIGIAPGFRYHQGLLNIYRGTSILPARFNRTLNTSFELSLGIRYNFGY